MIRLRAFPIKQKNKIVAYRVQDIDKLAIKQVTPDQLKNALRNNLCQCVNLTLTSDNRLVQHEEKIENPKAYLDELSKLATDDYQHRGGDYPASDIPDTIGVSGASISAEFKNTPEAIARRWLKHYLEKFNFTYDELSSYQVGDYHDDWVQAYAHVTGKRG